MRCDSNIREYVDKIENGLLFHMWSPAEQTNYQDVTAETGYSIIKISYRFDYKGKERGVFPLNFELDYDDGYIFTTEANHFMPAPEGGIGYSKTYDFLTTNSFEIDDPLNFIGEDAVTYIVVNDIVITDTEKPLVLKIEIPISPDTIKTQGDTESVIYDLRSIEFNNT